MLRIKFTTGTVTVSIKDKPKTFSLGNCECFDGVVVCDVPERVHVRKMGIYVCEVNLACCMLCYVFKAEGVELQCSASGYPSPKISFLLDVKALVDAQVTSHNEQWTHEEKFFITETLNISQVRLENDATFSCVADNRFGSETANLTISVASKLNVREAKSSLTE